MSEALIDVEYQIETDVKNYMLNTFYSFTFFIYVFQVISHPNISNNKKSSDFDFALPSGSIHNKMIVEDLPKFSYTSNFELENTVTVDHCYARPWNWRPDNSFLRPTKTIFVTKPLPGIRKSSNPLISIPTSDEIIDVESESETPTVLYNIEKAKNMMEENQRYALNARPDQSDEDWEEKIVR